MKRGSSYARFPWRLCDRFTLLFLLLPSLATTLVCGFVLMRHQAAEEQALLQEAKTVLTLLAEVRGDARTLRGLRMEASRYGLEGSNDSNGGFLASRMSLSEAPREMTFRAADFARHRRLPRPGAMSLSGPACSPAGKRLPMYPRASRSLQTHSCISA